MKDALIIDERWNGGGQIPTRFIEMLNRPVTNYWATRDSVDWTWPPDAHRGRGSGEETHGEKGGGPHDEGRTDQPAHAARGHGPAMGGDERPHSVCSILHIAHTSTWRRSCQGEVKAPRCAASMG